VTFLTFVLHHTVITGGQVNYVESQFEDDFGSFNLTRWMPTGSYTDPTQPTASTIVTPFGKMDQGASQDHCPAAGAVGATSPGTCTLLDPAMLATNVDLTAHGYVKDAAAVPADTGKGAIMTLSQAECYSATTGVNNPDCCSVSTLKNGAKTQVCASWAGTHISSNFGVQYGVLETEAAFNVRFLYFNDFHVRYSLFLYTNNSLRLMEVHMFFLAATCMVSALCCTVMASFMS
jgi:hypothetical protein